MTAYDHFPMPILMFLWFAFRLGQGRRLKMYVTSGLLS